MSSFSNPECAFTDSILFLTGLGVSTMSNLLYAFVAIFLEPLI